MSNEIRPLNAVLHELKTLVEGKSSGFLFLVADDGQAASIRLRNGNIEEVSFNNRHSDEAVQLLMKVGGARARFQPSVMAAIPSKHPPLSAASIEWLFGGHEEMSAPATTSAQTSDAASAPSVGADQRDRLRPIVEKIALTYFGPIAALLCEEAFDEPGDIGHTLIQIARNLPERAEADRFLYEVRAAIAKSR
jgi:hypothetical protein